MRERLTTVALAGTKVATAGLWQQDYVDNNEAIEVVGERQALLDDTGEVAAIIEITRVETHHLNVETLFVCVWFRVVDSRGEH
jgi:uncharacterized protein YhfF